MEIKRFDRFTDFCNYNVGFIESNRMLNVFLIIKINEVLKGETKLYKFFNIENEDAQLIVLMVTDICLIYSNKFYREFIPILSRELEFHKFIRYTFAGTKQEIEELLIYNNSLFSVQKHLIIYRCDKALPTFNCSSGEMQAACHTDLKTLIRFHTSFISEYNGENEQEEKAENFVLNGINGENMFIWRDQDKLCSVAQVIFREENDYPEIGHVYTDPTARRKGYAPSLIFTLTNKLLAIGNNKCMLYTDGTNPASNRTFVKVGYHRTGEYIRCYKEK